MKKSISLLLSAVMLLTVVLCPLVDTFKAVAAPASTESNVVVENTFDEGWNPVSGSNLLKTIPASEANGYALQFNSIKSLAAQGNDIRHYKIYNSQKMYGGYVDFKPDTNTTYKLTFRYRTRSINTYDIHINVRGVENGTVGSVLVRAATIKSTLLLNKHTGEGDDPSLDYVWDTAVAYFTTPEEALQALAVSVEYSRQDAATATSFNVTIDDVKLETAPSSFVLANTFEEDDVYSFGIDDTNTNGTINSGTTTGNTINSSNNMNKTPYSDTTVQFKSANAVTARTNRTLGFRALRPSSDSTKPYYEIYDYSKEIVNNKLQSFVPEVGANYKITFDYKVKIGSKNIFFTIRPVTVVDGTRTLGEPIATAVYIPTGDTDHSTVAWKTASVNVPVTQAVEGLALAIETDGTTVTTYTYLDNIVVHKYDSDVIVNDYEETILGKGKNATAMASTKLTGGNLYHLGTKPAATPNTSRVLQFERITGQTQIALANYTYAEIYNPYDVNFAGFQPEENAFYKLSFDYKVKRTSGTISFNIRGKTGTTLGNTIVTAATIAPDNDKYSDYAWGYASVLISTAGKTYETLAISIETSATGNAGIYPYLDNIKLEKIADANANTSLTVHHGSAYGKDEETIVRANSTLFTDITFDDTKSAKFEGLYFDSEYTIPAIGCIYGETDVYAKWSDSHDFTITFDESGVTLAKLEGEALTFVGTRASAGSTKLLQLNNIYGKNHLNEGRIAHLVIYNPNDENFTTAETLPSFKPIINSVYKITFDTKIKASSLGNVSLNIRGKKDGKLGEILGTARVIRTGDTAFNESVWVTSEAYVYTDGIEYDALALAFEADSLLTTNIWPYVDNIKVERVTEYESGAINKVAHVQNNKNGLMAIKDGKWFEVAKNDYAKVSFKLSAESAIANCRVAANIIGEDGDFWDIELFDFSNKTGEGVYSTTFKAPVSGKVVLSVYKNDYTTVYKDVILSDVTIDAHTPSIMKGDTNIDGNIDILDLVNLHLNTSPDYLANCDYLINSDLSKNGEIDVADLTDLRKIILDTFTLGSLDIGAEYEFANENAGSAAGVITLTSNEAVDNFVDIYWGADGKPIDTYYYIGSTAIENGQSVNFELGSHKAIPNGATQIIINDGLATKAFDITKSYDASFVPDKIGLVKDYTKDKNVANVKVVYPSALATQASIYGVSETYDLICEFRNELSDVLGAEVEFVSDNSNLGENQNYIVVGNTKYAQSTTVLESVTNARDEHHGDFAIKAVGRQIYINAPNDYALQFAFDYFLNTYGAKEDTYVPADLDFVSSSTVQDITLADVSINEYNIVYPEYASVLEVDAANYLAANIVKATGKAPLSIVNDAAAVGNYEILIGHTNRTDGDDYSETADSTASNAYTITVETNRTIITGGTNSAVNAAVIDFTEKLLTGSLAIGEYTGTYDGSFSLTNGFKLTWSDEFNGTALNEKAWGELDLKYATSTGGNVVWSTDNATVENGALKATVSTIEGTNNVSGLSLDTYNKKHMRYGYFEARVKSFDQTGYMNGFWGSTIGEVANYIDGVTSTYYGEFDILEMYEEVNVTKPNLHNHRDATETEAKTSKNYLQGESALIKPQITVDEMSTKYHTFAMEWTDDYIYFYLDGIKYYSFDCTKSPEYDVFDVVARIRLTFSAGVYLAPGAASDEAFVDWVRVWQKSDAGYIIN